MLTLDLWILGAFDAEEIEEIDLVLCRVSHLESEDAHNSKGSNATKGNVESLFFFSIVIAVRTPMDIFINAIIVAPWPGK